MTQHALLSPSGFKALMLCPAKPAMERGLPDKSSDYADEGTAAHFLGSTCLEHGTNASDYVGREITLHDGAASWYSPDVIYDSRFTVDIDMAADVQVYIDLVRDLQGDGTLFVEQSLPIGHVTGEEGAEGTGDAVIIRGNEIIVVDLKFGRGVEVDAEMNPQLMLYGLGALEKFDLVGDIEHVRMAISQPRITRLPSEFDMSAPALVQWGLDTAGPAAQFAQEIYDHGTQLTFEANCNPHAEACRFCKAKPTCRALAKSIEAALGAEFTDLTTEDKIEQDNIVKSLTGGLSSDQLGAKMSSVELIEMWCKAIRARVESELLNGSEVAGFKLVQGKKGNRAWTSDQEAEAVMKSMRLKKGEMYDFKIISPTNAEKLLKKTPKRWARIAPFITQSDGKPSVAPISDKRPALELKPIESEFEAIAESAEDLI